MIESNTTPMLKQYHTIKVRHKDCILFFRLGDFYEMFYDDAHVAAPILDLVLTARGHKKSGKVPMCGIPYHAADNYIARLIKAGKKVAICEQVEDPALAKGIVKRDVIRVITAGTFIDEHSTDTRYILALSPDKTSIGVAFTDTAGGCIYTNQYTDTYKIVEILAKLPVYECVFPADDEKQLRPLLNHPLVRLKKIVLSAHEDWCFNPDIAEKTLNDHFGTGTLKGFGVDTLKQAVSAGGALLEYLKAMHKQPVKHLNTMALYVDSDYVFISPSAVYGLELEHLVETLDHTRTSMGKRALKHWVYHPLKNIGAITARQNAIELLKDHQNVRQRAGELLRSIPDSEKAFSRISCGYTHARDLLALRNTLTRVPELRECLAPLGNANALLALRDPAEIRALLENAINPEIPLAKPDGKIIRPGYNAELDTLRDIQQNGTTWLKKFQRDECARSGINSLKIGFNKVFGYYIEITKTHLSKIPEDYIRKQTLVNAERFITPALKEFEETMLSAEEKVLKLENQIIAAIKQALLDHAADIHTAGAELATLDALTSLTEIATADGYVKPAITDDTRIEIIEGRHPVVETLLNEDFVPNDTTLDSNDKHLLIITGPNMAGKSTYIRQVAILVVMAQMGSFIPARQATIGLVDKIFTRIGAHDDITKGRSTFMVEMSETAEIINNLSERSLVILDEIGRGTSTFDGLSLAWAIAEFLAAGRARALFATHFHELTALAEEYPGVKNYNVAVKEWNDEIIFMHTIVPGSSDDSYGIYVAKLAGIPQEVVKRARKILTQLELSGNLKEKIRNQPQKEQQLSLFSPANDPVMEEIKTELGELNIANLTPLEALNKIQKWQTRMNNEG